MRWVEEFVQLYGNPSGKVISILLDLTCPARRKQLEIIMDTLIGEHICKAYVTVRTQIWSFVLADGGNPHWNIILLNRSQLYLRKYGQMEMYRLCIIMYSL